MDEMIELAKKVRENAYTPYSNFKVGAVLKTKSGKLYSGCNIENFGIMSICAERVAFTKALSNGEKMFESILILGGKDDLENIMPCGYCRQFISEFVDDNFKIFIYFSNEIKEYSLKQIFPNKFCI